MLNYFVIITREDLPNLPYSVEEIYGIHTAGKYHDMKKVYNAFYCLYSVEELSGKISPNEIIVEDSNSGYEFFDYVCKEKGILCGNAGGKSKIIDVLRASKGESVLVVRNFLAGSAFSQVCWCSTQRIPIYTIQNIG
ncbi:MAG: hypothetical protein K2N95_19145 [Lachnospiraceae bacterium]|nr:hypothetical protein [Lachnospiraceae bacterium]